MRSSIEPRDCIYANDYGFISLYWKAEAFTFNVPLVCLIINDKPICKMEANICY